MINIKHLLKVVFVWTSIVYVVCYVVVVIYPPVREIFMKYALHGSMTITSDYLGVGYFISGLIIWNILAVVGAWLYAMLYNKIK